MMPGHGPVAHGGGRAAGPGRRRATRPGRSRATRRSSCTTSGEPDRADVGPGVRRPRARACAPGRAAARRSTGGGPGRGCSTGCSSPANRQDRGLLRTGRHEGDWEMVQYRLRARPAGPGGLRAALGRRVVRVRARSAASRGHPVVFLARGSHAAYFGPGVRDRMWPDPNDEADGRGRRVRPAPRPRRARTRRRGCATRAAGARRARAGSRARWTRRAGRRSSPRGAGRTRTAGRRRRGRARGATATSAASATGARRRSRASSRCWRCWSRLGRGAAGAGRGARGGVSDGARAAAAVVFGGRTGRQANWSTARDRSGSGRVRRGGSDCSRYAASVRGNAVQPRRARLAGRRPRGSGSRQPPAE